MRGNVTDRATMLEVQGDRVLTHVRQPDNSEGDEYVLTFVHVVDVGDRHELRLTNRDVKKGAEREPDWPVSQRLYEAIKSAPENKHNCKWFLKAKC